LVTIALADRLRKKYDKQFKVPKLLKGMAENGETFYIRFDPYAKLDEAA
jgi:3-hydroxyacyl-CoA dehydrogenase/enoyl-CoA hydratase/3-hydroxybutyryl-CoA epimerase